MTEGTAIAAETALEPIHLARPGAARRGNHPSITLAIISSCLLMVVLDITVVNIALPQIQTALNFSSTNLAWVLNAYTLAFGGLLLLGGRIGDIAGRRRVFLAGIALFTVASFTGGLAQDSGMLMVSRALQGVGAAFASPNALALLTTNFSEGPERNHALSVYAAIAGAGGSIGLIIGGMLTDWASWRWVLFINVPVGILIVVFAPLYINESEKHPGSFDLGGAITQTVGMASLVYGFLRVAANGWSDPGAYVSFAIAALLLTTFVILQTRAEQPIMPLRLLKNRNRAGGLVDMILYPATLYSVFFFLTQFVQDVLGFSPVRAGLAFLPMSVILLSTARTLPRLIPKFGARRLLITGTTLLAIASLWLSRIEWDGSYSTHVLGPMILFGIGAGLTSMPINLTILAGVRHEDSGAASGMLQTAQQVGGSLGLAILVTVFGTSSRNAAKSPVPGLTAAQEAQRVMTVGMSHAFIGSTIFALCAALVALFVVRSQAGNAVPSGSIVME